jgi:hypothetical protein
MSSLVFVVELADFARALDADPVARTACLRPAPRLEQRRRLGASRKLDVPAGQQPPRVLDHLPSRIDRGDRSGQPHRASVRC